MTPQDDQEDDALGKSYDASNPAHVKAARKRAKRDEKNRQNVVNALMQHKEGRAWVWQDLIDCYIFQDPVVVGDVYATYINLGVQRRGKRMLMDAQENPELYIAMVNEAKLAGK